MYNHVGNNLKKAFYILILVLTISCKNEKKETNPLVIEYQNKGIEYHFENKIDSAIVFFKKALEIESTDITTIESLIKIYWDNQEPNKALAFIENLPREAQESTTLLIYRGMSLEKLNKSSEAMKLYKKAFKVNPKVKFNSGENIMEFVGYLLLQTVTGEKDHALVEFDKLKKKKLTESEKQYIKSIEPVFRNYKGGGYNGIFRNK